MSFGFPLGEWVRPAMLWPHEQAPTAVESFRSGVERDPLAPYLHHADRTWSRQEIDDESDTLAAIWQDAGLAAGDRIALQLQNVPLLVTAVLAAWKLGAVVVPINPMYRSRELAHLLTDSAAISFVHDDNLESASTAVEVGVPTIWAHHELAAALLTHEPRRPHDFVANPDQPALITYTSGTTGPAKGARALHRHVMAGALVYRNELGIGERSIVLAAAPLCHVTGMIGHLAISLINPCQLVLPGRFDPDAVLDLVERKHVTFMICALTAYRSLLAAAAQKPRDLSSLDCLYSGGAPVTPDVAREVERVMGTPLGNAYGLTESTSISHATPRGAEARVDPATGVLSIGKPAAGTTAWIEDQNGNRLGPNTPGELVIDGPGIVGEYWRNPEATSGTFPDGALHTGDVAFIDEDGWTFLIDRLKDQINASGFKVWPREVEDVLNEHPAVDAAAVFGVTDDYRGESVAAAVTLAPGQVATAEELITFTRSRLASFKCPRTIRFLDEIPMTTTGKILRRELREREESSRG